jgi:hypothetical protein
MIGPHSERPARRAACPICQWVIGQDHDEALVMHETWLRAQALMSPTRTPTTPVRAAA